MEIQKNDIIHITGQGKVVLERQRTPELKQVLLVFDNGSIKGYNKNAFIGRIKEYLSNENFDEKR